jgi:hypothetical protein
MFGPFRQPSDKDIIDNSQDVPIGIILYTRYSIKSSRTEEIVLHLRHEVKEYTTGKVKFYSFECFKHLKY